MRQAVGAIPPRSSDLDVLACDDERHILRLIQVNLERQGYTVRLSSSGEECLRLVREKRPDILVLDTLLGDMTGYEVAAQLEANPQTSGIPIIFLGSKNEVPPSNDDWPSGPTAGACLFLTKPFNPMQIIELFRSLG